jgi:hypothetical protein
MPLTATLVVASADWNAFTDLDVVELPRNPTVALRTFKTTSSARQGVFSAMAPQQVEAVPKEIVAEVSGK